MKKTTLALCLMSALFIQTLAPTVANAQDTATSKNAELIFRPDATRNAELIFRP